MWLTALSIMYFRGLLRFIFFLPCASRRNVRIGDFYHDEQQHSNALNTALDVSIASSEALLPQGFAPALRHVRGPSETVLHATGRQGHQLHALQYGQLSGHLEPQRAMLPRHVGPRHAAVALHAGSGPEDGAMGSAELLAKLTMEVPREEQTQLSRARANLAARVLEKYGVVLLKNAFPLERVEACAAAVSESFDQCRSALAAKGVSLKSEFAYAEIVHRSKLRYDMQLQAVRPTSSINTPLMDGAIDSPPWQPLLEAALGYDVAPLFQGAVIAAPGAGVQTVHMDGGHLYQSTHAYDQHQNPVHCVNVFVPLVNVTPDNGPTEFWPGSHVLARAKDAYAGRMPSVALAGSQGDLIVFDYRVVHRGLGNHGTADRPVLYLTYARPWFRDCSNFPDERLLAGPGSEKGGFGGKSGSGGKTKLEKRARKSSKSSKRR